MCDTGEIFGELTVLNDYLQNCDIRKFIRNYAIDRSSSGKLNKHVDL